MNHIRNIKEMLSIPAGTSGEKPMCRNVSTSGYSSFTDSQIFFGTQFWPENSQSTSQDMSLSSSSQEASDPKFSSNYRTKPLLFGELKGKTRPYGILDKFEEDRKKAKENNDSNLLAKECQHTRETHNTIQQLVAGTDRNIAVCQTVLEKFDNFASTMQNNLKGLQNDISQHFETMLNKVNSLKEEMTELEESGKKSADTTAELGSNLQSLKSSLESLREEQERERNMLAEALKLLSTLVSEHSAKHSPQRGMSSTVQASLGPEQSLSNILLHNKLESTQLTCTSHNREHKPIEVPPQKPGGSIRKKKLALKGNGRRRKRPLVLSQRSKRTVSDENSPSLMNYNKVQNVATPLGERCDLNTVTSQDSLNPDCLSMLCRETRSSKAAGGLITPFTCWSQDSSSSMCLAGIEPILEKLSAESKPGTPMKPEGLWQLFDMDRHSDFGF
ncbi:interactor of HORMAD1 protein 1 isoform X2 [Scophthalmus maximus]|uniref:interactor of HORMAD1 protein 1 isoform X2 n=1 Tax=Scophthalmus maximus TaxID=52904 RepID=UPI001FA84427|nr:interactor of HORMAD1 protein 1 isoform X2 [Scophthalmus maximus]